jgi:hypothetical protein
MSLYNMLHGFEPTAPFVIRALEIDPRRIGRFRDAYLTYRDATRAEPIMVVLTRTGGGNRPDYEEANAFLRNVTGYVDDADDEFDPTFALFRYQVPPHLRDVVMDHLKDHGVPLSLREKTMQATGPDQTRRQKTATEQIAAELMRHIPRMF